MSKLSKEISEYDSFISERWLKVVLVTAGLGLIPILGIVPGVVFYRSQWSGPYRKYLGAMQSFMSRWGTRVGTFTLISLQLVPGVGVFLLPAMAGLNYFVYRNNFMKAAKKLGLA